MNVSIFIFQGLFFWCPEFFGIYLYAKTTKLPYCCSLNGLFMKAFFLRYIGLQLSEQMRLKALALTKSPRVDQSHYVPMWVNFDMRIISFLRFTIYTDKLN